MSNRYRLFRNSEVLADNKGTPVNRFQNFDREKLFSSSFQREEFEAITYAMNYLDRTLGVESIEFKTKTGIVFLLEKVKESV